MSDPPPSYTARTSTTTVLPNLSPDRQTLPFIDSTLTPPRAAIEGQLMGDHPSIEYKLIRNTQEVYYFTGWRWKDDNTGDELEISRLDLCQAWALSMNVAYLLECLMHINSKAEVKYHPASERFRRMSLMFWGIQHELGVAMRVMHTWETTRHIPRGWRPVPRALTISTSDLVLHPDRLDPDTFYRTVTPTFILATVQVLRPASVLGQRLWGPVTRIAWDEMERVDRASPGGRREWGFFKWPEGFPIGNNEVRPERGIEGRLVVRGCEKPKGYGARAGRAFQTT